MPRPLRALSKVEEGYLRLLLARGGGVPRELGARSAADPELERLHARWCATRRETPVSEGTIPHALRSVHGDEVDPGIRLGEASASSPGERPLSPPEGEARDYTIVGRLAEGRLGTLLEVRDHDLGRSLAMKVHREGAPLQELLREAALLATLRHPGVLPVHELGVDRDGRAFFTMRRLRGARLRRVLELARARRNGWSLNRSLGVLVRVCNTIAAAHERGVVHGDLRPEKILVGDFGEVVVTGWGRAWCREEPEVETLEPVAHPELSITEALAELGGGSRSVPMEEEGRASSPYTAPEAADPGAEPSPRSDVYSLGALLHLLVTGRPPGAKGRVWRGRGAPRALLAVCRKSLRVDPARRYADPMALADELRAFTERRVVRAYRVGAVAELLQWIRRNRALTASLAATLLLLAGGLASLALVMKEASEVVMELADQTVVKSSYERFEELPLSRGDPESIEALERWLAQARDLRVRARHHRDGLKRLREELSASQRDSPPEEDPSYVQQAREAVQVERTLEWLEGLVPTEQDLLALQEVRDTRDETYFGIAQNLAALAHSPRRGWSEDARRRWRVGSLTALVDGLEGLGDPGTDPADGLRWSPEPIPLVEAALELHGRWETELAALREERWSAALADLATSDPYGDLALEELYGFIPLERDRRSGLWELWHVPTGEEPRRGPDGEWLVGETTGMVFVLLPGGTLPLHEARLGPFLISKYEMTQAQWRRFHDDRSFLRPDSPEACRFGVRRNHPQEQMKPVAKELEACMRRLGFTVPTEEQWEYAARGGTSTRYWFGDRAEELPVWEHVPGPYREPRDPREAEADFDSPVHVVHAPVGSVAPNPFGLYDVLGNVAEWCRAGDGTGTGYVARGGHFDLSPEQLDLATCAHREVTSLESTRWGIRPVVEVGR